MNADTPPGGDFIKAVEPMVAGEAGFTAGCNKCGLIGCDCHVLADAFANICKKCRTDPCECEGKPIARTLPNSKVCSVCRRAECICQSHHGVRAVADASLPKITRIDRDGTYTPAYKAMLKNEALTFYYNRDAEGLVRWLERVLR